MVKIGLILSSDVYYQRKLHFLLAYKDYLKQMDIEFSNDPDLVFIQCSELGKVDLNNGKKYILCAGHESSLPTFEEYNVVKNPNIISVYRHCILKNLSDYNAITLRQENQTPHGVHLSRINGRAGLIDTSPPAVYLDEGDISKFKANLLVSLHPYVASISQYKVQLDADRTYDVAGIFSIIPEEDNALLYIHRLDALKAVSALNVAKKIVNDKPMFDKPNWFSLLHQCKICVNPWGWGEFRWADLEAFYFGCIVIKPYSDFCKISPVGFESGVNYFACKDDFSDLDEVVQHILDKRFL